MPGAKSSMAFRGFSPNLISSFKIATKVRKLIKKKKYKSNLEKYAKIVPTLMPIRAERPFAESAGGK